MGILSRQSVNLGDDPLYVEIGRDATRSLAIFFYPAGYKTGYHQILTVIFLKSVNLRFHKLARVVILKIFCTIETPGALRKKKKKILMPRPS